MAGDALRVCSAVRRLPLCSRTQPPARNQRSQKTKGFCCSCGQTKLSSFTHCPSNRIAHPLPEGSEGPPLLCTTCTVPAFEKVCSCLIPCHCSPASPRSGRSRPYCHEYRIVGVGCTWWQWVEALRIARQKGSTLQVLCACFCRPADVHAEALVFSVLGLDIGFPCSRPLPNTSPCGPYH